MKKKRKYIPRKQFKFWLTRDVAADEWLMEIISYWKERRQFTEMVKNGIRLMWSLGQGHTDILFELFPHLEAQLAIRFTQTPTPDSGDMQRQIEAAVAAGVEKAMHNLPALPAGRMVAEPAYKELGAGIGSTLGAAHVISLPTFDDADDDDTVVVNVAAISNNSATAIAAMMKIAY